MPNEMIDRLYQERVLYSLAKIESPRNDLTFEQLKIYYILTKDIYIDFVFLL